MTDRKPNILIVMVDQLNGTFFPDGPADFLHAPHMMALAARWRKVHGDIDFVVLAKNPTIDAWWALLSREVK